MSAWRRVALEKLPEYRPLIEEAENPMSLWIELQMKFLETCRSKIPDDGLIRRCFEYAQWCLESRGEGAFFSDAGTAAVCVFYEHLPLNEVIRNDLARWLTREEFINLRRAFRHHLSDDQFASFEAEFLGRATKMIRG